MSQILKLIQMMIFISINRKKKIDINLIQDNLKNKKLLYNEYLVNYFLSFVNIRQANNSNLLVLFN